MPGYAFQMDAEGHKDDTGFKITLTWADATTGSAIDISSWTFAYEANEKSGSGGNVAVADGAMTKSDSGSGTTDTLTIPISFASLNEGRYSQHLRVTVGGEITTVGYGTLEIKPSEFD